MWIDGEEYISLEVNKVKRDSPKDDAILVDYEGEDIWIPRSHLEDWPDAGEGGEVILTLWIAKQKDMI